jgi:hypothetical protein
MNRMNQVNRLAGWMVCSILLELYACWIFPRSSCHSPAADSVSPSTGRINGYGSAMAVFVRTRLRAWFTVLRFMLSCSPATAPRNRGHVGMAISACLGMFALRKSRADAVACAAFVEHA